MRHVDVMLLAVAMVLTVARPGRAQTLSAGIAAAVEHASRDAASIEAFASTPGSPDPAADPEQVSQTSSSAQGATAPPPRAFEYSEGYHTRAKIHRIASFATLPLFVTQGILGGSLYNNPTDGRRTAHQAVAASIGGLFALNTTTGLWNLLEARKDPNVQKRRLVHGLLMLGSDAGFLATALTAPPEEGGGSRATHRALAITSIGAATTGYLIMLFGAH